MSTTVNLTEAKKKFSEIVDRVHRGEEIIITRMGHPVARITRYEKPALHPRIGLFEGQIRLADDFDDWPTDIARNLGITD